MCVSEALKIFCERGGGVHRAHDLERRSLVFYRVRYDVQCRGRDDLGSSSLTVELT